MPAARAIVRAYDAMGMGGCKQHYTNVLMLSVHIGLKDCYLCQNYQAFMSILMVINTLVTGVKT